MRPSMQNRLITAFMSLMWIGFSLKAEEEQFVYKGSTRTAKTKGGIPVTVGDSSRIRINNLRPVVLLDPRTGICSKSWQIQLIVYDEGEFDGQLTSEEDPGFKIAFPAHRGDIGRKDLGEFSHSWVAVGPVVGQMATRYCGEQARFPMLWRWLESPGESWIPFHFSFQKVDPESRQPLYREAPIDILQWTRLRPEDLRILNEKEAELVSQWKARRNTKDLSLPDGQHVTVSLLDGFPDLEDGRDVRVEAIEPVRGTLEKGGKSVAAWQVRVRWKDVDGGAILQVSSPLAGGTTQARLPKNSFATVIFGIQQEAPKMWSWCDEPGETWMPFRLKFIREIGDPIEFLQWVKFTPEAKRAWKKLK